MAFIGKWCLAAIAAVKDLKDSLKTLSSNDKYFLSSDFHVSQLRGGS